MKKKIKVLSDPLLKIIFIFIIFADGTTGTVFYFYFLLSQPTDMMVLFCFETGHAIKALLAWPGRTPLRPCIV